MMTLSGRSRIIRKSEDLVLLVPSPTRRIMFFLLFLLLAATMALAIDPRTDFSGPRLLRTAGYSAVLLVLLGAAGWSSVTSLDRGAGSVETMTSVFGVTVKRQQLSRMADIEAVVLQKVVLLGEGSPRGGRSGVFGTLFEPQSELYKLYMETENGRLRLDEGGGIDQLEKIGSYFAEFLGVDFSREEIE
ncbi:MAG: hypothetical protein JW852_08900 [Spirochaetales bacterium]|nr:hypothetical protein [Spirochaetales bacterium]